MRRILAVTILAACLAGGQACAHARLVRADPRVGASVPAAPQRLWLRFDQVIRLGGASGVELTGPDGRTVRLEPLARDPDDPRAVLAPLPAALAPGRYHVSWRALSPDGHRTEGAYDFHVS
jgi:methionine-rich copper-binding protein CopC